MICPICFDRESEMKPGAAVVRGTVAGFLICGLSYMRLYFESDDALGRRQKSDVLGPRKPRQAWRCPACGAVLIDGTDYTEIARR